jgi:uncharacterized protein (DUF885 family)
VTSARLLVLALVACHGGDPARPPLPSPDEVRAQLGGLPFDDFLERSFELLLQRSPMRVVELGLEDTIDVGDAFLDDLSDGFVRETQAVEDVVLELARGHDRDALDDGRRVALDAFVWWLDDRARGRRFADLEYRIVPTVTSAVIRLELFFTDVHPLATEGDAERYVRRLEAAGAQLRQVRDDMARIEAAGILPPRLLLEWSRGGIRAVALAGPTATPYYRALERSHPRPDLLTRARSAIAGSILPAYRALDELVAAQAARAPQAIGVWQHPDGAAYYAHALRHHVTAEVTAAELHELGLAELARVHDELDARFAALGYPAGAPLAEQLARVAADSGQVPDGELLATYTAIIADAKGRLGAAFDAVPSANVHVTGVPNGGFYVRPSLDGSRPGVFFATVRPGGEPRFGMRTLAYHETVPGHHLQIGLAQDLPLPLFQRTAGFTGFVEGWALYAEWLAGDLGWYAGDPHGDIGRLQAEAFRAARLVVDTGIHDRRWSFDEAVAFFRDATGFPEPFAAGQVARYASWPGQACAYWMGRAKILELRRAREAALGDGFDVKAFHRAVLGHGSVPLEVLSAMTGDG